MGAHRNQKSNVKLQGITVLQNWPPFPNNMEKIRKITAIDGSIRHFKVEDEIIRPQSNSDRKIIVLQRMRYLEKDRVEFRFGYYMIGLKSGARGRWVWGQFCLLIPQEDLLALLKEARKRKWFQ